MKKILFVFILSLYAAFSYAQTDLHFGFQASPSWSWLATNDSRSSGSGSNLGLKLGLILENRFSQSYAITSGIGFHFNTGGAIQINPGVYGKQWRLSRSEVTPSLPGVDSVLYGEESKFRYNLTFVEIPIGLKLRTPETGSHTRFFVEPGLTLGIRTRATGKMDAFGTDNKQYSRESIDIGRESGIINLSWGLGVGGEYIISNNNAITAGIYFQRGFVDATDDDSNSTFEDPLGNLNGRPDKSVLINSFTLRLGLMF
ncbi:MAG: PorT family protein [Saprospiraceae bacterium]|nr:PorT family protein [Saprospiraceae bacterium]